MKQLNITLLVLVVLTLSACDGDELGWVSRADFARVLSKNAQLEETYKQQEDYVQLHRSEARKAIDDLAVQEQKNKTLHQANVECQEKLAKQDYVRGVIDTMALICPALVDKVGLQVKEMAKKK